MKLRVTLLAAGLLLGLVVVGPEAAHGQAAETAPDYLPETTPASSSADSDLQPAVAAKGTGGGWYGYQTLIVDALAIGLFVTGGFLDVPALWAPALVVGVFGSPVVHWSHGNGAMVSLLVRLGGAAIAGIGALVILATVATSDDFDDIGDAVMGTALMGIGAAAIPVAAVLDATIFAYEPTDSRQVQISPWFNARTMAGGIALSARY